MCFRICHWNEHTKDKISALLLLSWDGLNCLPKQGGKERNRCTQENSEGKNDMARFELITVEIPDLTHVSSYRGAM